MEPNWPRPEAEKQNKSDPGGRWEELRDLGYPENGKLREGETPWVLFYISWKDRLKKTDRQRFIHVAYVYIILKK